jgi:hypothetical protein
VFPGFRLRALSCSLPSSPVSYSARHKVVRKNAYRVVMSLWAERNPEDNSRELQEALLVRLCTVPWRLIRFESRTLALFSSARRSTVSPRPARLMK